MRKPTVILGKAVGTLSGQSVEQALEVYGEVYGEVLLGMHRDVQRQRKDLSAQQDEMDRLSQEMDAQRQELHGLQYEIEERWHPIGASPQQRQAPRRPYPTTRERRTIYVALGLSLLAFVISVSLAIWMLV